MNDTQDQFALHQSAYFGPRTRSIYFSGPIDYDTTLNVIDQLLCLSTTSKEPIKLYINTEGGSLTDALAIYDVISTVSCPVDTVVQGLCASGGILLFLAGRNRYCSQNSLFFYHQPVLKIQNINSSNFSKDLSEAYDLSKDLLDNIVKRKTQINSQDWKDNFNNKTFKYFDAKKAKEWGFATSIIKNKEEQYG